VQAHCSTSHGISAAQGGCDGERGRGISKDRGDDQGMHASAPKLSSDRVAYVVQAGGGVHPRPSSEPPEPTGEGVRINEEPVPAVAHEGDRTAEIVDRVPPSWAKSRAPFQFVRVDIAGSARWRKTAAWGRYPISLKWCPATDSLSVGSSQGDRTEGRHM
jgi:hypothetical protein